MSLLLIAGCAGSTSGTSRIADFFGIGSATPAPTIAPMAEATQAPAPAASPAAEITPPPAKRTVRQTRTASDNAAIASKEAAAAALASKQAASVANKTTSGSGPTSADVSLEPNEATPSADPYSMGARATPSPGRPTSGSTNVASISRDSPTLRSSALESSGPPVEENPERAAKLIEDLDKIEKRIDRKNLDADDSQRDILAQRLLQEAKKALAERDDVAALSLATKASTLLEPLPKVAASAIRSTP